MGLLSLGLGGGTAYGMWNLVSLNERDLRMGDIFQIRNNMAGTNLSQQIKPVMCVAP